MDQDFEDFSKNSQLFLKSQLFHKNKICNKIRISEKIWSQIGIRIRTKSDNKTLP